LSELQPRRVQDGRFLNVYNLLSRLESPGNYGESWSTVASSQGCRDFRQEPFKRAASTVFYRVTPWVLLDREFFSRMQRLAFERGGRRAILGKPSTVLAEQSASGLACRISGANRSSRRAWSKHNLIEATTMSHNCATEKSTAPFRKHPDYLQRGGVYEKADWIASILPGKLGNGKNAGG
jgi:hypothetical protein